MENMMARTFEGWAATYIEWESIADDYEQGEGDESFLVLSESIFIQADDPISLIEKLAERYGIPERKDVWAAFDGRLTTNFLVDDNNYEADDRDIERWKVGQQKLWNAHISVDVAQVSIRSVSTSKIANAFGVEDMGD